MGGGSVLERTQENVDVFSAEGTWEVGSAVSTTRFLYLTPGTTSLPPGSSGLAETIGREGGGGDEGGWQNLILEESRP